MMSEVFEYRPFSLLPEKRAPWAEFAFSISTQTVALLALAWVGVLHPEVLVTPAHDYHFISLVETPPPVNLKPAPVRMIPAPVTAHLETPSPAALRIPADVRPKIEQVDVPVAPKVNVASTQPPPLQPATPVIPRQLVKTNVFSTGSSETPTIARAPQQVQTGGFGDPNGVPARENNGKPVTIARLGSYDLPAGPGYGNGTGGARGVAGVVASAGFGSGVATGDGSGRVNTSRGNGIAVQKSGFGDAQSAPAAVHSQPAAAPVAKTVPAEILSKPTPAYTEEARKMHIEGEVLLEVVFESSGKLRVTRVVRGLGHGLDDSAVRAAEQIRFKPALRDGQPADSTAVLHIVFQMA
jgi:TonB family protein